MKNSLPPELQALIPLDKAWMIRMGMLDIQAGKDDVREYLLAHQSELGDDLLALLRVLSDWGSGRSLDVGESGTLYRFTQYLLWLKNSNQKIITRGTLQTRTLHDDPGTINYPFEALLQLDGGTSQWASAKVLFTDTPVDSLEDAPYHLHMSVAAKEQYKQGWGPRTDQTIQRQAEAFYHWLQTNTVDFDPQQAEDYPFAVAFGVLTIDDGASLWPQLRNHETNRVEEMRRLLNAGVIDSPDHRIVQALAMRYQERRVTETARRAVNKTWPQFWQFLDDSRIKTH
ncbi:hypothetical protein KC973_02275 [Candidatus Saccharibacteria bacterium]|nr:hypothetical protein [Candidatus Saccharibacteria bacterium]